MRIIDAALLGADVATTPFKSGKQIRVGQIHMMEWSVLHSVSVVHQLIVAIAHRNVTIAQIALHELAREQNSSSQISLVENSPNSITFKRNPLQITSI